MATSQPALASFNAVARPMPREPPVTNAIFPASGSVISAKTAAVWLGLQQKATPGTGTTANDAPRTCPFKVRCSKLDVGSSAWWDEVELVLTRFRFDTCPRGR